MKKVLFVIYSLGYGGAERSIVNLLNELSPAQYDVDLLLFQKTGDFLQQLPQWVNILETPEAMDRLYGSVKRAGKWRFRKVFGTAVSHLFRKTRKAQRAYRWKHFYKKSIPALSGHYDVAVAYTGSENMYFVRDRVSADRKLVWIHNDYRTAKYSRQDDYPYLSDMDAIVSVSAGCVAVLQEEFPEFKDRIHYIENITSSAAVRKLAELFVPEEYQACSCNILSVGRLFQQKGFDMAIEAAVILKEKGLQFRWYIIGTGMMKQELLAQIQARGVEDCVFLLGTRNNPYPYIKNCDLFVQTSRYEGKSVVLDEAKILGKPILTTAYPTAADQIRDGAEGVIVDMTPEAIADGILRMLEDKALFAHIQQYLEEHEYGNQAEVEKYIKLLDAK